MKKIFVLIAIMVFLTACSKKAHLKFINKTSTNAYFSVNGIDYILAGKGEEKYKSKTIDIDCGKRFFIFDDNAKKVKITNFFGETFAMHNSQKQIVFDTQTQVKPGKTLGLHIVPNFAGIKIINTGSQKLSNEDISVYKVLPDGSKTTVNTYFKETEQNILWERVTYCTPSEPFSYLVKINFKNGTAIEKSAILYLDEQEVIEVKNE